MKSLLILGRQPDLGLAELESLYGASVVRQLSFNTALLDVDPKDVNFTRLGGSIKLAKVLMELPSSDWRLIERYLSDTIPEHLQYVPEGKFKLGLSVYGLKIRPQQINETGLRLKKVIKAAGRSVRVVPNKSPALNSAQVLHNQLTGPTGWELLLVKNGTKTLLAQTVAEQDIDAYAARDQKRPMRDAKVGMLPPKLAQIIINLATAKTASSKNKTTDASEEMYEGPFDILDPFCGTGVVLQEALLMGYSALGSDKEPRMIEYATKNLQWLTDKWDIEDPIFEVHIGDATQMQWREFKAVAGETYLGPPLSQLPEPQKMRQIVHDISRLHNKFLQNIGAQMRSGSRMCLAVPAWKSKNGFIHLSTLDKLPELGYTRIDFRASRGQPLIYHREDQVVGRELVVLEKK